jgi:hypothetical protein
LLGLTTLVVATLLIVTSALLPLLSLGAMLGGAAGLVGLLRRSDAVDARWLAVGAVGGAVGAVLATWITGELAAASSLSAMEALFVSGFIGTQVGLLEGLLVIAARALVALHGPRWLARLDGGRDEESRAGA